jgi:hypothetical protein
MRGLQAIGGWLGCEQRRDAVAVDEPTRAARVPLRIARRPRDVSLAAAAEASRMTRPATAEVSL